MSPESRLSNLVVEGRGLEPPSLLPTGFLCRNGHSPVVTHRRIRIYYVNHLEQCRSVADGQRPSSLRARSWQASFTVVLLLSSFRANRYDSLLQNFLLLIITSSVSLVRGPYLAIVQASFHAFVGCVVSQDISFAFPILARKIPHSSIPQLKLLSRLKSLTCWRRWDLSRIHREVLSKSMMKPRLCIQVTCQNTMG